MQSGELGLTYVGHGTVGLELDGLRLLSDPVLRGRVAHLRRYAPPPDRAWQAGVDAVLLTHLHRDHCDLPSLRRLGQDTRLIVPSGAGRYLGRFGFHRVEELPPGESTSLGAVQITATPAEHSVDRPPFGPRTGAVGYVIGGSRRIYLAGDTDLFPGMAELGPLDLALLPISGWGTRLGPGHLDPLRAAQALQLLRPAVAVPMHWGTFARMGLSRRARSWLTEAPPELVRHAGLLAPDVDVHVLLPGQSIRLFS